MKHICITFYLIITSLALAQKGTHYERPGQIEAEAMLSGFLLPGPGYEVDRVEQDGRYLTYHLHTDYGSFTVTGRGMLRVRIAEHKALQALFLRRWFHEDLFYHFPTQDAWQ